jgi:hypothetical protein
MGAYKEPSDVLEVRNSQKQVIYEWKDEGKQVLDPQTAYIISDILADKNAKHGTFGTYLDGMHNMSGGIKTAIKTGTSDIGGLKKDFWMVGYTPKTTTAIWWGNHIPAALKGGSSSYLADMLRGIMVPVYNNVFKPDGTWKPNEWFTKPAGIQSLKINGRTDIYPSWYNKNQKKTTTEKKKFDKVSKKLATNCTPASAIEELDVIKNVDPLTKQAIYTPPEGYDTEHYDDVHKCGTDQSPFVSDVMSLTTGEAGKYYLISHVRAGTHPVSSVVMSFNGNSYNASQYSDGGWRIIVDGLPGTFAVNVSVTDSAYYTADGSDNITFSGM